MKQILAVEHELTKVKQVVIEMASVFALKMVIVLAIFPGLLRAAPSPTPCIGSLPMEPSVIGKGGMESAACSPGG